MRRVAAFLIPAGLALALGAPSSARADEGTQQPAATTPGPVAPTSAWTFGGEVFVGGLLGTLHGLTLRGVGFRAALGGHHPVAWRGREGAELGALITVGGFVGRTPAGLAASEKRIGLGARARLGRLLLGADAELLELDVERVSTTGRLRGTGLGVRLLAGYELVRLGPAALFVALEGDLDALDPFSSTVYLPVGQAGVGLRW